MSKVLQTRQQKLGDLVIFDFDGTLADTSQVFIEAFDKAAPAVGALPYKREEAAKLKELDAYELLQYHGVQRNQVPGFIELVRLEMSSRVSGIQLFPDVLSVLSELVSEGHTLAVVTSNSRETVSTVIGEEFDKLFSFTCFNTPIAGKEEVLKKLVSEGGAAPTAVFYIGDELRDFRAASAAGINFIGVSWGFNTACSLRRAGCPAIIDQLSQLSALLPPQRSEDLTQHLNALYGYAMVLSRDSATAADLVQETYLRAIAAKDRLWQNSAVKSWLFTILRNVWLNQLRKAKSEQSLETDGDGSVKHSAKASPESSLDPGIAYEQKITREMVRAALAQLPQEFREVILLREFEDLPYQEIAKILGCPPGTVMSRLARARARLRTLLAAVRLDGAFSSQVTKTRSSSVCT